MSRFIKKIIDEIVDQYAFADDSNRPWIIGFSGGKDSTVLLQLVWKAVEEIKGILGVINRKIYVVCNDTLVENPIISSYVDEVLDQISQAAVEQDLPIQVVKTSPKLEDSFWVNMIGKGYPVPTSSFRWCTERLKIKPTDYFLSSKVGEYGEAVLLIGTRRSESSTRAKSISKFERTGQRLHRHPLNPKTSVYSPIKELNLDQIWYIINTMRSPWGANNKILFDIYSNASADDYECPTVITDKKHKSCGQSRFGCWVCTLVKEDKSMNALISNGLEWMKPLADLRNELVLERNLLENRMPTRRNGATAKEGLGTYTPEYRASVLSRLLNAERKIQQIKPRVRLIQNQELIAIQTIWYRDLIFDFQVSKIFSSSKGRRMKANRKKDNAAQELRLLKEAAGNNQDDVSLISDLLKIQKSKSLLVKKRGLMNDLEHRINQEVSHTLQKENTEKP